jgi:hypothetical protein
VCCTLFTYYVIGNDCDLIYTHTPRRRLKVHTQELFVVVVVVDFLV